MSYFKVFDRARVSDSEALELMNRHAPPALKTLGGKIRSFDRESGAIDMTFTARKSFCHSGDIVQGGFVTGMLDAAMTHAVFLTVEEDVALPTLEIKVSFLDIARQGKLRAIGTVLRLGKSTAFLEGRLYDSDGTTLAIASATARVLRIATSNS